MPSIRLLAITLVCAGFAQTPSSRPIVIRAGRLIDTRAGRVLTAQNIVVEGDRIRILVTNKLPEATSVHWHGVRVPNGMDGVSGLTQPMIAPGETFQYEFTLRQHGTQMYHPHFDEMTQIGMGMMGFFVIHPRDPDYMAMGKNGMGDMMQMGAPRNSIPMLGGEGPHGAIDMGGMFTILKVREGISSYEDPGWYAHPPGSQARAVKGKES